MIKSGIYKIENLVNGKVYIGQSRNLRKRLNEHFNNLRKNKHVNNHLQSAFNKYCESSFDIDIIEYCEINELTSKELYWIEYYKSHIKDFGYNIDIPDRQNENFTSSEETKNKISIANTIYSNDELISYLHEYYYHFNKVPSQRDLSKTDGFPTHLSYYGRFGSFKNALIEADLYHLIDNEKMFERKEYTKEEVMNRFKEFVDTYGRFPNHIEQKQTSKFNLPTSNVIINLYGSIETIKEELGFGKEITIKKENAEALIQLKELYIQDGKVTARSIDKSEMTRSGKFYRNRFGTLAKACEMVGIPYALHT